MPVEFLYFHELREDEAVLAACPYLQGQGPGWLPYLQTHLDVASYSRAEVSG